MVDELFAVSVNRSGTKPPHFLSNQEPCNLLRVGSTCRVILNGIHKHQFSTRPVGQDQPVGCGTVVIGRGEVLGMQPAHSSCCHYNCFGLHNLVLTSLHVIEHRPCCSPFFVQQQFHSRAEFDDINVPADHLIPESPHYLGPGIIAGGMHAFA